MEADDLLETVPCCICGAPVVMFCDGDPICESCAAKKCPFTPKYEEEEAEESE
jgi:hypothetical protein